MRNTFKQAVHFIGAVILILSLLISPFAQAQPGLCQTVFESQKTLATSDLEVLTRDLLATQGNETQTRMERLLIQAMRKTIEKKVTATCRSAGCTEKDVAHIVESSIVESLQKYDALKTKMRQIRGYAILVGISVAIAVVSHFATGALPPADLWLSDLITTASSIGIYKIGAPLWDQVGGVVFRGAFRMQEGKSFIRHDNEMSTYETKYRITRAKMTVREQEESTRVAALLNATESSFSKAIEDIRKPNVSEEEVDRACARIALLAIKIRKIYPEISAEDDDLLNAIHMTFTQFLADDSIREQLNDKIIKQLKKFDPDFYNVQTEQVYRKSINNWLGLKP